MNNKAIPTEYKGVRMRSRLEAKWAFMFDALGWKWEYEPIDCDGWIPDFVLLGSNSNVLVEVKPVFTFEEAQPMIAKIDRAYPPAEGALPVLLLGATTFQDACGYEVECIGWTRDADNDFRAWWTCAPLLDLRNRALFADCPGDPAYRADFASDEGSFQGRLSGAYEGGHLGRVAMDPTIVRGLWAAATNSSQWRKAA